MNADRIIFREAVRDDIGFMCEILVDAAAASGVRIPIDRLSAYPDTYQYVEQFPKSADVGIIAQTAEGRPVGAAWVRMLPTNVHTVNHPMPELTMGVTPEYRRTGIGEKLLIELYKAASAKDIPEISLGVHRHNTPAIKLYQKQGWTEDGMFEEYIMMSRKTRP